MLKRTPLWAAHRRLGGRLVEFGGWEMPVQYTGIVDEHLAVRAAAGLFDISHMGEILVKGPGAFDFLNRTLTNDLGKCPVGRGQYTLMCNEAGGVVDDLYVYHTESESFLLVVNASRIEADFAWLQVQQAVSPDRERFELVNASDQFGAIAAQGPKVVEFINQVLPGPSIGGTSADQPARLAKNEIAAFTFSAQTIWLARTGYTGEDGFELVIPAGLTERLWQRLLDFGQSAGIKPCGLGARDTLRTEMCYPLYGHELDLTTTPLEAGLGVFVALDKGEFVGRAKLAAQKAHGLDRKTVAFTMSGKSAPPRPGYPVWNDAFTQRLGTVASGTQSPSVGMGIGMACLPLEFAAPGTQLRVEIRGKPAPAQIVRKPIYRKPI